MRIVNVGLGYAVTVALARSLGPAGFGVYSVVLALISLLGMPAQFGLPVLLVREIGAARAREAWGLMRGLGLWAHGFVLIASLPIFAIAVAVALLAPRLVPPERLHVMLWGAALIILLPLMAVRGGVLRGLHKVVLGQAAEQIVRPVAFLILLAAPLLWGRHVDTPEGAMSANVISTGLAWAFGTVLLLRFWPPEARRAKAQFEGRRWGASILSMGLANSMFLIDGQIGVLILGALGTAHEAGIYKAASQGALFSVMGYVAVNTAIGPRLAAAWSRGDRAGAQVAVTRGARLSIAFSAPVCLVFILIGEAGIELAFGKGFGPAYWPLLILTFAQMFMSAFGSSSALLNMTHNERLNTISFGAGLAMNVAFSLALIPAFGAIGAAAAAGSSIVARTILQWWFVRRRLNMKTGFWAPIRPRADGADNP